MLVSMSEEEISVTHAQLVHTMQSSTVPVIGVHPIQSLQREPPHQRSVVIFFLLMLNSILNFQPSCACWARKIMQDYLINPRTYLKGVIYFVLKQNALLDTIWMGTCAQNVPKASGSWQEIPLGVTVVLATRRTLSNATQSEAECGQCLFSFNRPTGRLLSKPRLVIRQSSHYRFQEPDSDEFFLVILWTEKF